MKKQFGKLFIIFGVILCIFALVGCDFIFVDNPDPEKNPAEESSSETSDISEESTIESSEKITEDKESVLIYFLVDYLRSYNNNADLMPPRTFEQRIDSIKGGTQALHVGFESSTNYYFMCGYYETQQDRHYYADKYVWVKYEKEDEILEYYNDKKMVVAFQINEALFVTDILPSEKSVPNVEHFQLYDTEFVDGINVNAPDDFCDTFIYLNHYNMSDVFCCTDVPDSTVYSFQCVLYDYEYYVIDHTLTVYSDGSEYKNDVKKDYGKYCDALMEIMIAERGVAIIEDDALHFYGLFPVDDFLNEVLK